MTGYSLGGGHLIAWLALLAISAVGCAGPTVSTPTPSSTTGPTAGPSIDPAPRAARLTITAKGLVGCATEGGCQASIELDPTIEPGATLAPDWEATGGWRFAAAPVPEADFHTLGVGAVSGAPPTIAPGQYRVIVAVSGLSDVVSPGSPGPNIMFTATRCEADLTVTPTTTTASIAVAFALEGPCAVAAAAD